MHTPTDEPLRVVVVDDEPLAREDLVQLLVGRRGVSLVGACATGSEAIAAVRKLRPDVLFLDIRLPGLDGFNVVERLDDGRSPHIVFVTAFDTYAIEAFRVRALDYILKPVQAARLDEALDRAREQLRLQHAGASGRPAPAGSDKFWQTIMVRAGRRDIILNVDEIDWVEADTYYARLHVRGKSYLLRERMHILESRLDPRRFSRVHRSAIVNLARVREIDHDGNGDHIVVLSTGARVKTSQDRWVAFKALMRQRTTGADQAG